MTPEVWATLIGAFATLLIGAITLLLSKRKDERETARLNEAAARQTLADVRADGEARVAQALAERDYQRRRADELQAQINDWNAGRRRRD